MNLTHTGYVTALKGFEMADNAPNQTVLVATASVCAVCAGVVAFLAHTIVLEQSGSTTAAWTSVAVVIGVVGLLITLLLRLRNKQSAELES